MDLTLECFPLESHQESNDYGLRELGEVGEGTEMSTQEVNGWIFEARVHLRTLFQIV